ncbi:MAG: hypothetical protein D6698_13335 [Gammaproteobacteria bacterium]|nr:MAG: hypothetical protein D6698_13335 [Gammaproteobacteria bacterium]
MKSMIKLSLIAIMLGIGSQAAVANALQDKIQARKDIVAYGKKFECEDFVKAANKGDLVLVDAFIRAGIRKTCDYGHSFDAPLAEPNRSRAWANNALSAALARGHFDIAQMLLDYGVPFEQEREPWHYNAGHHYESYGLYPRPALLGLLYPSETKKEATGNERLKALKWAVERGADVNVTEFIRTEYVWSGTAFAYAFVVSPLTAAMRLEKLSGDSVDRAALYERSLSWVEYLLKHGAKLNPPLAPIVEKAIKSHQSRWSGANAEIINYPFDLSVLFKVRYARQGAGIFKDIAAVNYRIKLANLLIKYQNAKTDRQKYNQALKLMEDLWEEDKKGEYFPLASRKALAELNKIIRSRMM